MSLENLKKELEGMYQKIELVDAEKMDSSLGEGLYIVDIAKDENGYQGVYNAYCMDGLYIDPDLERVCQDHGYYVECYDDSSLVILPA